MYLRASKRRNKNGTVVEYYHLAHNIRHPETKVSTPKIVHNFGRADRIDREELVRLCKSIARVCGLEVSGPLLTGEDGAEHEAGLPKGVEFVRSVELGTPFVIEALWERLGIGPALRKAAKADRCKAPYERALLAMTANRLCAPESKLGVWDRWLSRVFLPSCDGLKLEQMYEAMDLLHRHCEEVERSVFFKAAGLLDLDVDIIFYDTTTASFSIDDPDDDPDEPDGGLRRFGHSKEGGWSPQVVVALAVTRDGIPVRTWVFPGNTTDITTIEQVRSDLKGWKLGRALFVGDSGMNSEKARRKLSRACGRYLLAVRMASVKEVKEDVLSRRGRYKVIADNLLAKEVVVGQGALRRRYILCRNPKQAEREKKHREQVLAELEKKLSEHPGRNATAQWAVRLKASGRYGRYLKITKDGQLQIDRHCVSEAARHDGKWVIITNDDSITVEHAATSYKALLVIERCFRSLKHTQIRLTPMYHWVPRRIETHVKICVLALLIARVAELACQKPWARIHDALLSLQAGEYHSEKFSFFQRNEPGPEATRFLKDLAIWLPKRILAVSPRS
jgi:hypothetical protein